MSIPAQSAAESAAASSVSAAASATTAATIISEGLADSAAITGLTTTDAAVEVLVKNTGGVGPLTSAAVAAASGAHESATDFTSKSNGEWSKADTGQPVVSYPRSGAQRPQIASGKLVAGPAVVGPAGGYSSQKLAGEVYRVGARWTFDAGYTTNDGVIVLAATVGEIGASYEASAGVPKMPCHLTISPVRWTFDTFPGAGGAIVNIASAFFDTPLVANGVAEHAAEVILDTVNGVATLLLPDGSIVTLTNAAIAVVGAEWAFVQEHRNSVGSTDPVARVRGFWADSRRDGSGLTLGKSLATLRDSIPLETKAAMAFPAVDGSFTPSGAGTNIAATTTTVTIPASGKVLCLVSAFLDMTADGLAFYQVRNNAGATLLASVTAATATKNSGQITIPIVLTGLTPGTTADLSLAVALATGTATVKLHNGGSDAMLASLTVIPIA